MPLLNKWLKGGAGTEIVDIQLKSERLEHNLSNGRLKSIGLESAVFNDEVKNEGENR
jgi:hypothetical protein